MLVEVNLLPKKNPKNYALLAVMTASLLLALAVGGSIFWHGTKLEAELNQLDNQIKTTQRLTEIEQSKLGSNQASNSIATLTTAVKWAQADPLKAVPIIKQVASLLPYRGFIQTISYTESGVVNVTVQFDSNRDAAFYFKHLLDSEWVKEVQLSSLSTTEENANLTSESADQKEEDKQYLPRYTGQYTIKLDRDFINKYEQAKDSETSKQGGSGS